MAIAYTEVFDSFDTIEYEKQVSYDLKNKQVINNLSNSFLSLETKQKNSIQDMSNDLLNADFDSFISDDSMDIDRDQITNLLKLIAYTGEITYLEDYIEKNNLELISIDKDLILKNKNYLLRNIDNETLDFFEKYNVKVDDNFMKDIDYKNLINFNISHYENLTEDPITNEIIYIPDIELKDNEMKYPSYKDLWEEIFKNDFIEDLNSFTFEELLNNEELSKTENILDKLSSNYKDIEKEIRNAKAYELSIKEVDLDNDGIPDRIDIDDTRNSVQTTSDLYLVGNKTDKYSDVDLPKAKNIKENEGKNEREIEKPKRSIGAMRI